MKILVINTGSSSIKYELFDMDRHQVIAQGLAEKIGESSSHLIHKRGDTNGRFIQTESVDRFKDHRDGLIRIVDLLIAQDDGYWIIDHKSDQVSDIKAAFSTHLSQLMAYASIIDGHRDKPVLGVGINWVRNGQVSFVKMEPDWQQGA